MIESLQQLPSYGHQTGASRDNGKFAIDSFRKRLDQEGIAVCKAPSWDEKENNGLLEKEPVAFSSCPGVRRLAGRAFSHYLDVWEAYTGSGGSILQGGVKAVGRMVPPKWSGWHLAIRVSGTQTALIGLPFPILVYFKLSSFALANASSSTLSHSGGIFDTRVGSEIDPMVAKANEERFEVFCKGYEERSWSRELVFSNAPPERITGSERIRRPLVGLFWQGKDRTVADYDELRNFESSIGNALAQNLAEIRKIEARERKPKTVLDDCLHEPSRSTQINYVPVAVRERLERIKQSGEQLDLAI